MTDQAEKQKTRHSFPIKKRLRISVDIDLDWRDPLASEPDAKLEAILLHLLDKPLLVNKLYGLIAVKYLQYHLSNMDGDAHSDEIGHRFRLMSAG
jgi:hypothetical protein